MKTQEEIQQLSEKDFNNRQSVGHYELADLKSRDYYCDGFSNGYNQCQEVMADKKYTEEDLREAISLARKTRVNVFGANGEESIGFVHSNNEILKIVTNKKD